MVKSKSSTDTREKKTRKFNDNALNLNNPSKATLTTSIDALKQSLLAIEVFCIFFKIITVVISLQIQILCVKVTSCKEPPLPLFFDSMPSQSPDSKSTQFSCRPINMNVLHDEFSRMSNGPFKCYEILFVLVSVHLPDIRLQVATPRMESDKRAASFQQSHINGQLLPIDSFTALIFLDQYFPG
jgi:hypothetical protein